MYPTKKLWEVCEILDNKRIPISSKEREKRIANKGILYPYYWATQQNWFIDDYIFDEELVLLWEDGVDFLNPKKTKAYLISGKTWVNNHAHVLKWLDGILNNTFLLHFLNIFDYFWIVSGTTRLKLNQSAMKNIPIPLPPLSTQKLIVEKLDAIFAEIEKSKNLLEKNLENLEEMNKSILEKIFSNEEWERKKLWEVCEVIWWWTPKTEISEYWWEDIIWLSPTDLPEVWEITKISNSTKKISILWLQNSSAKLLPVWSVIFSSRATIGKIAINDIELSTNQGFTNFVCSGWVYNYFLAYALKNFTKDIIALSNSTTFKEVNKTNLRNFSIPLPPLETQKNIVSYLDNIFAENQKLKNLYQAQIKNLDEMKQSFLKKAFAGELV